ncbi:hypothetical protein EDD11_001713 [Mortierella claussenii]|nr:hypothetical protein EDD11_001713 [Mortierella claussenii]
MDAFDNSITFDDTSSYPSSPASTPPSSTDIPELANISASQVEEDAVSRVFELIQENGMTLWTFLLAAFNSKKGSTITRVKAFYQFGGPAVLINYWKDSFRRSKKNKGSFVDAAMDIVIDRLQRGFNSAQEELRSPAEPTSSATIDTFSFKNIQKALNDHALRLVKLLSGLLNTTSGFQHHISTDVSTIGSMLVLEGVRNAVRSQLYSILYDSINYANRVYDQRIDHHDTFESGTTATIVIVEDLGTTNPAGSAIPLEDFLPDEDTRHHFRCVKDFLLIEVLLRHYPAFENVENSVEPIAPLPVRKKPAYPIPAMNIDQSSNEGNLNVLLTVTGRILQLPEEAFHSNRVIISGDQLTMLRYIVIKRLSQDKPYYYATHQRIKDTFDSMLRRLWEIQLGTEQLRKYESSRRRKRTADGIPTAASKIRETHLSGTRDLVGNANINVALFLRDASVYIELYSAIKVGDVGQIEKAIMEMTIMFQAGGTTNYANELLRLVYGIRRAWSLQWKKGLMSSWLINTEGKAGRWIPADLYQEHNNLLIKSNYAPKGSNKSWETLANKISANVRSFSKIAATMEVEFGSTYNSKYHATVAVEANIQ